MNKEIKKATEMSELLYKSGMMNNDKICIKDMGSTFVCVCANCLEEFKNKKINRD